jgi:hypothetical protein
MAHARTTVQHLKRHLHLHPRGWLKDTRDSDYAVGQLMTPSRLPRRDGS